MTESSSRRLLRREADVILFARRDRQTLNRLHTPGFSGTVSTPRMNLGVRRRALRGMAQTEPAGWLYSLFAGTIPIAVVSWIGFLVTIAGVAVALYQLAKIRTASEASAAASRQMLYLIRERMNLTELVAATGRDEIRKLLSSFDPMSDMLQRLIAKLRFTPADI